tara:strand:- start:405 stop:1382 length:978 start_codon:yes stop_codon:yes gene_type:complete
MVLCPCSAELLFKLSHGGASDLPSTLFLARPKTLKVLIAPAMNLEMWSNLRVQENIQRLHKEPNTHILNPQSGVLACGEQGKGRLPEPAEILQEIDTLLKSTPSSKGSLLITGGGTSEPIDDVRVLSNRSTGKTAVSLAKQFLSSGYQVDLLLSQSATLDIPAGLEPTYFSSTADLKDLLQEKVSSKSYDAILHAAAVSDYFLSEINGQSASSLSGKLDSSPEELTLKLKRNPKLISHLREWSKNKSGLIVGFKLTSNLSKEERSTKVQKLFESSSIDAVIANDLTEISETNHHGTLYTKEGHAFSFEDKASLFETVQNFIGESI